jgi:predicted secreted protein
MTSLAAAAALAAALVAGAGADPAPAEAPLVLADTQNAMTQTAAAVLDESSAGAEVKVGDRVEVRLKAQFGTGFSWALAKPPETALRPLGDAVVPAEGEPAPEGGYEIQVFTFEAAAAGETELDFVYRRPWQPNDPSNKHVTFVVKVLSN